MTIRLILSAVETTVEALTPITASAPVTTFRFADFRDALAEIPQSISHRAIRMRWLSWEPRSDIAGVTHVSTDLVELALLHVWKTINGAVEAEKIRAEDVRQITEAMLFRRPGSMNGARLWSLRSVEVQREQQRTLTGMLFAGNIGVPSVVTPS